MKRREKQKRIGSEGGRFPNGEGSGRRTGREREKAGNKSFNLGVGGVDVVNFLLCEEVEEGEGGEREEKEGDGSEEGID